MLSVVDKAKSDIVEMLHYSVLYKLIVDIDISCMFISCSIIWYQRKLGSKQAYRMVHQPVSRGFAVFADAWLSGWLAEISADLRETVAH